MTGVPQEGEPFMGDYSIWREFIKYEQPDGHTFHPIDFLVLCRGDDAPPTEKSWEEMYVEDPVFLAHDLIVSARNMTDPHRSITFDALLQSALLVAETIGRDSPTEWRNEGFIISKVFWIYFGRGDFEKCEALRSKIDRCEEEAKSWIEKALADPVDYSFRLLEQRQEQENRKNED